MNERISLFPELSRSHWYTRVNDDREDLFVWHRTRTSVSAVSKSSTLGIVDEHDLLSYKIVRFQE